MLVATSDFIKNIPLIKFQKQTSDFIKGEPMKLQTQTSDFIKNDPPQKQTSDGSQTTMMPQKQTSDFINP
jgi:hypothetical protein